MHESKIPSALISVLPYLFPDLSDVFSKTHPHQNTFLIPFFQSVTTKMLTQKGKKLKPLHNVKHSPSLNNTWLLNCLFPSTVVNYFTKEGSGIVPCTDGEI